MAKITDPDNLQLKLNGTATTEEVEIQTGAKTIELTLDGDLDDQPPGKTSGVTAKALYSFLKEEWLGGTISQNDVSGVLRRFKFPLKMIFEGSFIWVNGWKPLDDQTRDLIRDAGFQEEVTTDEYSCLVSLGLIDAPASDQVYYTNVAGFTQGITPYDKTGELNENIQIKGGTGTDNYVKSFLRVEGKLYAEYSLLAEQGLSVLGFQAYSFPLSNGEDLKITVPSATYLDAQIDTGGTAGIASSPYGDDTYPITDVAGARMRVDFLVGNDFTTYSTSGTYAANDVVFDPNTQALSSTLGTWWITPGGGTVTGGTNVGDATGVTDWVSYFGEEQINKEWYAFNRIIDCNGLIDRQIYAWSQFMLRQTTDINANCTNITSGQGGFGSVNGNVAALLVEYVGDTLKPQGGVLFRNFDTNSTNNIIHRPILKDQTATNGDIGLDSESVPLATTDVAFPFVAAGNFNFSDNLDAEDDDTDTFYTVYFQYITSTTDSNIALALISGLTGTIDYSAGSAATITALDLLQSGDYIDVQGFTGTTTNNGLYVLTGNPTAGVSLPVTKQDTANDIVADALGEAVTILKNPFESPGAVIVNDNSGPNPLSGDITSTSIGWDFDYTSNIQDGRTPNEDAPIIVVAQTLVKAEWISATHTITKASGQNIAVNSGDERNYANAV